MNNNIMPNIIPNTTIKTCIELRDVCINDFYKKYDWRKYPNAKRFLQKLGYLRKNKAGKYVLDQNYVYFLPPTTVFLILRDAFEKYSGYSITKHKSWEYLNINNSNSYSFSDSDVRKMEEILLELHYEGLIQFYACGSIWSISII